MFEDDKTWLDKHRWLPKLLGNIAIAAMVIGSIILAW